MNYDITELQRCCLHTDIEVFAKLSADYTATDAVYSDCNKIFVGHKNSAELVHQLELKFGTRKVEGYLQQEHARETNIYATYFPKSQKNTHKYTYTLYKNAVKYDNSVAGTYLNLSDFTANTIRSFHIQENIPIKDFLVLQAFYEWPNAFGELFIMTYLSKNSLVYCQVDPIRCAEIKAITSGTLTNAQLNAIEGQIFTYSHKFAQVGQPLHLIQEIDDAGVPTPVIDTLDVIDLKCHTFDVVAYG
jgi:hypothetical protein